MKKYGDLRDRFIAVRWLWEHDEWLEKPSNKAFDFIRKCKQDSHGVVSWPQIAASFQREHGAEHEAAYFERLWRRRQLINQKVKVKNWMKFWS